MHGHERGSFTGATERREGRFEAADGGTVFLDEIGEIGPEIQVKLLRFIETRSFERIGSTKTITVDVRLVAATNRNLEDMVKEKKFREDLYFRLNVVRITTPPLRERSEDIPVLLEHFIAEFSKENAVPPLSVEPGALRYLMAYPWPGNIRELRNFAENAVVLRRGGRLTESDLEPKFRGEVLPLQARPALAGEPAAAGPVAAVGPGSNLSVGDNEKRLLRQALIESRGNRTKAAKLMGISRRTLHRKIAQWPELDVMDRG